MSGIRSIYFSVPPFIRTLLFTLLCFVGTYACFGFYYEEMEAFFNAFYSGKLSPGTPFYSWYYMAHIGISYLYVPLYQLCGGVEWMSWILYGYMLLSCAALLHLVRHLLRGKWSEGYILLVQFLVYAVVMADSVVHFQYTRIAYFMCAAALLAIVFLFPGRDSISKKPGLFVFLNLALVVGTLTRLESSMAVTSLLGAFALFYQRNWKHTLRTFAFPVLVVLTVFGGILYDIRHTDAFYKRVEPDIETQITCRRNYIPLGEMKTARDSVKHMAAVKMLWADPEVITVPFLRSLLGHDSALLMDARQWKRTWGCLRDLLPRHGSLLILNGCIILLFFALARKEPLGYRWLFLMFQCAFVALVVLQTYTVKINDRSFSPYVSLFTFLNGLVLLQVLVDKRRLKILFFVLFGFLSVLRMMTIAKDVALLKKERDDYEYNMQELQKRVGKEGTLVLNTSSFRFFTVASRPFFPFDFSAFGKIYLNEVQVLPTIDAYHEYLEKECACDVNNFSNFFLYLQRSGRPVYFLSDEPRMDLIRKYLLVIHGYNLDLQELDTSTLRHVYNHEMMGESALKLYTYRDR